MNVHLYENHTFHHKDPSTCFARRDARNITWLTRATISLRKAHLHTHGTNVAITQSTGHFYDAGSPGVRRVFSAFKAEHAIIVRILHEEENRGPRF